MEIIVDHVTISHQRALYAALQYLCYQIPRFLYNIYNTYINKNDIDFSRQYGVQFFHDVISRGLPES